jgi:hypothetical protein
MSIFFLKKYIDLILSGKKTQTRRRINGPPQSLGICQVHESACDGDSYRGDVEVTRVSMQRLGSMTEEDARREGFDSLEEFRAGWREIYHGYDPNMVVYVIDFALR